MATDDHPKDDKSKRMRDLLSSFYSFDSVASNGSFSPRSASLHDINTSSFDSDKYMDLLVKRSNLEGLLQKHVDMAAEIKNLDTDLQMLVYENYNKFVSATETIKRMKNNIVGMESNMEQLLEKIISVQSKSDVVNTSLFGKRERIEKLHRTRNLLRKVQFIYDLPARLEKCIKAEAYGDAVKFFTGAMPIFKIYGGSSFHDCKRASEEAMDIIINNLQEKLLSESEPIEARAKALSLLRQLDFPVDDLKEKLLERLKHFSIDLQPEVKEMETATLHFDEPSKFGNTDIAVPSEACWHKASIHKFAEAVHAYRVIYSDSEKQLIELIVDLFTKNFNTLQKCVRRKTSSADLLAMLRTIWTDVTVMDEVLPEAILGKLSLEAAHGVVRQYVANAFSHLLQEISESLLRVQVKPKEGMEEDCSLQVALAGSKRAVIQGSMDVLLEFRQLLDDNLVLIVKLKEFIIDWVQEGFQDFFRSLDDYFLGLSGGNTSTRQDQVMIDATQKEKVLAGLILVLAQLSVFIEQSAIPRITEEIAASFSTGGSRSNENGPAFVPGEICRGFRSAGEKFLHLYVNIKTKKLSVLLRKRFTAPNWTKHKEPRDVHMYVDLLLQELDEIRTEAKQILTRGHNRKHRQSESYGSNSSSRSNPTHEAKLSRSNTPQRARSQLLENHLAMLFKEKMEIFTRLEYTQESVVSTIIKLFLKSLQEFVRIQTFNRSGFQQIQLDIQFLRAPLKETVEDEAAIDFLLDEIIMATAERCLDPIPLEPAILDRLIQVKLSKRREQSPSLS